MASLTAAWADCWMSWVVSCVCRREATASRSSFGRVFPTRFASASSAGIWSWGIRMVIAVCVRTALVLGQREVRFSKNQRRPISPDRKPLQRYSRSLRGNAMKWRSNAVFGGIESAHGNASGLRRQRAEALCLLGLDGYQTRPSDNVLHTSGASGVYPFALGINDSTEAEAARSRPSFPRPEMHASLCAPSPVFAHETPLRHHHAHGLR